MRRFSPCLLGFLGVTPQKRPRKAAGETCGVGASWVAAKAQNERTARSGAARGFRSAVVSYRWRLGLAPVGFLVL